MPLDAAPQMKSAATHDIAVRVSAPGESIVDIHVAQRGGEVQVAVRTADAALRSSLHQDLGNLVGRLEQAGFHAHASESVHSFTSHDQSSDSSPEQRNPNWGYSGGRQHQHQQQRRQQHSEPPAQWRKAFEEAV